MPGEFHGQKHLASPWNHKQSDMIAQRIASVQNADRIAVLENGTITACAPHDELLRISPTYREIYASQIKTSGVQGGVKA